MNWLICFDVFFKKHHRHWVSWRISDWLHREALCCFFVYLLKTLLELLYRFRINLVHSRCTGAEWLAGFLPSMNLLVMQQHFTVERLQSRAATNQSELQLKAEAGCNSLMLSLQDCGFIYILNPQCINRKYVDNVCADSICCRGLHVTIKVRLSKVKIQLSLSKYLQSGAMNIKKPYPETILTQFNNKSYSVQFLLKLFQRDVERCNRMIRRMNWRRKYCSLLSCWTVFWYTNRFFLSF